MSATFHPVSTTFLLACSAVTADGRGGVTWLGVTLYPVIGEGGGWAFGTTTGITITGSALLELQQATAANSDGTYTSGGAVRALYLTSAGSCEPSGPPPPAP